MDLFDFQKKLKFRRIRRSVPNVDTSHEACFYLELCMEEDFCMSIAPQQQPMQCVMTCAACGVAATPAAFSTAQLRKHMQRRCNACVAAAESARKKHRSSTPPAADPNSGTTLPMSKRATKRAKAMQAKDAVTPTGRLLATARPRRVTTRAGKLMRDFATAHGAELRQCGVTVRAIRPAPIAREPLALFLRHAHKTAAEDMELVFHGTAATNLASICRRGLLVPRCSKRHGVTVAVAHGSSYGVGVYASTKALVSAGYCDGGSDVMFVCAVLRHEAVRAPCHTMRVADKEGFVLPLFLMRFSQTAVPDAVDVDAALDACFM